MEIVQIRFRIQIIPSVPERVHRADAVYIRQDGAVAPRRSRIASVAVACNFGSSAVVYRDIPPPLRLRRRVVTILGEARCFVYGVKI